MEKIDNFIKTNKSLRKMRDLYNLINEYPFEKYFSNYDSFLDKIHNMYDGQRCFIIATGPSLNRTNLSLIKDEISFGVNTFFRGTDKFGIHPKFWVVSDSKVFKQNYKELSKVDTTLFLGGGAAIDFCENYNKYSKIFKKLPTLLRRKGALYDHKKIFSNVKYGTHYGESVTILALQIAFHMGFKEVYLAGADCNYSGNKIHHFDGEKYDFQYDGSEGEDFKKKEAKHWSEVFTAYEICKKAYEKDKRKIYNATFGGKLEIFERKSLDKL